MPSNGMALTRSIPGFMLPTNPQQFGMSNPILTSSGPTHAWQPNTGFLQQRPALMGVPRQLPFGLSGLLAQQPATNLSPIVTPEVYTMTAEEVNTSPKGKKRSLETSSSSDAPSKQLQAKRLKKKESSDSKKKTPNPEMSLNGERRLVIHFDSFGTTGALIQTFGKARRIIPHGLTGCHTLYSERWLFRVSHSPTTIDDEYRRIVCMVWEITNVSTGHITRRVETASEALERMSNGRTITNEVFRQAMDVRADELEKLAAAEPAGPKQTSLQSRSMALRPRCFNQGILVFGLQHRIVQSKMKEQMDETSSS